MNSKLQEEIRKICTYHSDEGTSGYCLSEKQFNQIFDLFEAQKEEWIKKLEKEAFVPDYSRDHRWTGKPLKIIGLSKALSILKGENL